MFSISEKFGKFLLGLIVLFLLTCGVLAFLEGPIPDHLFFNQGGVAVIAHRGGRGLWPENTLYAFKHALDLGVDVLEMDLRRTRDGALVTIHDKLVDRTTNGTGPVQNFTLAELKKLDAAYNWTPDAGQSFPLRGRGITVPTLAEVFEAFPDARMSIEIKESRSSLVIPFCQTIRDYGKVDQVLVGSFHGHIVKEFRRACPEVATSAIMKEAQVFYVLSRVHLGAIYSPSAQALQVPEYFGKLHVVTDNFVNHARERNMAVYVWTVNDVEDMQRLLQLGINGIITDYPDRLLTLLGR
jgi:glycerophosphoryl diester phosphodiesterase